jgi:hypothetical protein
LLFRAQRKEEPENWLLGPEKVIVEQFWVCEQEPPDPDLQGRHPLIRTSMYRVLHTLKDMACVGGHLGGRRTECGIK